MEVLLEAGASDGVVKLITHVSGYAEPVVDALIGHDAVRRINFTGSTRVCRLIATKAAAQLKPVLLELGGKEARLPIWRGRREGSDYHRQAECTYGTIPAHRE